MKKEKQETTDTTNTKQGFTVIEVMLFLGVTGLMLVGVLAGTYSSIANQRYNDSLRSFAEFLRTVYAEVSSPESLGAGNSDAQAIYGKAIVFGLDNDDSNAYTATVVGDANSTVNPSEFMTELKNVNAKLFCGKPGASGTAQPTTLEEYTPRWEAQLNTTKPNGSKPFKGTVIIARSPSNGTIRAAYSEATFNINEQCSPSNNGASTAFYNKIQNNGTEPEPFSLNDNLTICVKSEDSNISRAVQLNLTSGNTSSVSILTEEESADCE